jgi:hypothetical protein
MKAGYVIAAMIAVVMFSGCLAREPASLESAGSDFHLDWTGDNRSYGTPNCSVMTCKSQDQYAGGSNWFYLFGWWFPIFNYYVSETTLLEGSCKFENKTPSAVLTLMLDSFRNDPTLGALPSATPAGKTYLRSFMYGQGGTFSEFDEANAFCNNNLSMAVKWVVSDGTTLPPLPQLEWEKKLFRQRPECYLRANVIPVYLVYTKSDAIDPLYLGNFVDNLAEPGTGDEIGPVVITPEYAYDLTKPNVRENIIASIRSIRQNCEKCLIMLTPPEDDFESLQAILGPGAADEAIAQEMNRTVDIIGQGWTLNKDEDCRLLTSVTTKLEYAKRVMRNYNKPTLWPIFAAANNTDLHGQCNWTERDIANAFDMIYVNTPALAAAGGIGLGHYQLMDANGPLYPCPSNNCSYGLTESNDATDMAQKKFMFNMWFQRCNDYYHIDKDSEGNIVSMNRVPLTASFFGDNGTDCQPLGFGGTYRSISMSTQSTDTPPDIARPTEVYSCQFCYGNLSNLERTFPSNAYYDSGIVRYGGFGGGTEWYTNNSPAGGGGVFPGTPRLYDDLFRAIAWQWSGLVDTNCEKYRATINKFSETTCKWEMDPYFVRAVSIKDSNLDPEAITYTVETDTHCGIGPSVDFLRFDPYLKECVTENAENTLYFGGWTRCKPCTEGLMRCTVPAATDPAVGPYGCGASFDANDVQQGICCGVNSLCQAIDDASTWLFRDDHVAIRDALRVSRAPDDWMYTPRDRWTILMLALAVYHNTSSATSEATLDNYYNHWQNARFCPSSGTTDISGFNPQVELEGPRKTFMYTYCYVWNTTTIPNAGGTDLGWHYSFSWPAYTDPYYACSHLPIDGGVQSCQFACCGQNPMPESGSGQVAPSPVYEGHFLINGVPELMGYPNEDNYEQTCRLTGECCEAMACQSFYALSLVGGGVMPDQSVWRCNRKGSCCGGTFLEHLCCIDPYICNVMDLYNQTVQDCDRGGFCRRF